MEEKFVLVEPADKRNPCIKVIGVGGAGCNAINHMIRSEVGGIDFLAANTDLQTLDDSLATTKLTLGTSGLGAGANPDAGRDAALSKRHEIEEAIAGSDMLFVTAGMGGGTGTGAAPVIAEIAKSLNILTIGVVTKPFTFEGSRRTRAAEAGIAELCNHVDSLIVVLNDRLADHMGEDVTLEDSFHCADDVLKNAVGGISEVINKHGIVNADFEDLRTVMRETGRAMMGSATASGDERARIAAEQAIASPLLEGADLSGARGVVINISGSRAGLKLTEVKRIMETVQKHAADDATIVMGAVFDDSLQDDTIRVTLVASGLGGPAQRREKLELLQQSTGTHDHFPTNSQGRIDYSQLEKPAVIRNPRQSAPVNLASYDTPTFLRRQAD